MKRRQPRPTAGGDLRQLAHEALQKRYEAGRAHAIEPSMAERPYREAKATEVDVPMAVLIEAFDGKDALALLWARDLKELEAAHRVVWSRWAKRGKPP